MVALVAGAFNFLSTIRTTLIVGAAAGVIGFGSGYLVAQKNDANHATVVANHATDVAVKAGTAVAKSIIAADVKDQQTRTTREALDVFKARHLQAQVDTLREHSTELQRLLNEKPNPDPDCHMRVGDLSLLNDAGIAPSPGAADGTPDPARLAAYQDQTPAALSCRAFVEAVIVERHQYVELGINHDALVDWDQANLIDVQLPPATDLAK